MKKLLGILILSLLFCGSANADEPRVWYKDENKIHRAHKTHFTEWHEDIKRIAADHCNSHGKYFFCVNTDSGFAAINKYYKQKRKREYKSSWVIEIFCSKELIASAPADAFEPGKKFKYSNFQKTIVSNNTKQNQNVSIEFNIKQKKKQCTAIGFKPETEKFADCVLRLVELDVKQQTQNQITVAQNNGNDALVKQLQRQNNLQSSQALIDLGQQLMNPKRYNSNIYMPQTQRCTVQGFGSFSSVTCR